MKIHFVCSSSSKSQNAFRYMVKRYGQSEINEADCAVVLSGDGMVLRTFHETFSKKIPIYGMNRGGIGFLTNEYAKDDLPERIQKAIPLKITPLKMVAENENGESFSTIAVNEVYLLRETHQSAKIKIKVNGLVKIKELICDGLISATPAGSTAYNYSANGPIIPLESKLMILTPISPFRPRYWRGALLSSGTLLDFEIIDHKNRPVCAVADYLEFRKVSKVSVFEDKDTTLTLLFDGNNGLEKKILDEQFST